MPRTTMVVPCYNEQDRLPSDAILQFVGDTFGIDFLFVNDGSRDRTIDVLNALQEERPDRIRVLDLPQNVGKGEAVRQGMLAALQDRPNFVGFIDADLAIPLFTIEQYLAVMHRRPDVDLVIGTRLQLMGRSVKRTPLRWLLGRTFAKCASTVLGETIYDTQCGAKLFRVTKDTSVVFSMPFCTRWIFDVEMLARRKQMMQSSTGKSSGPLAFECPLDEWHDVAGSKLKPSDFVKAFVDLVNIFVKYRVQKASYFAAPEKSQTPVTAPQPTLAALGGRKVA